MITFIKHDGEPWYPACPSQPQDGERKCQKKVIFSDMENMYRCEKCDMAFPNCENRYILSICITDHTGIYIYVCVYVCALSKSNELFLFAPTHIQVIIG